ncbi:UV DNA damage repair endonuclease UvsE [Anaerobacillus alkaliphilus]|uniref:UV DNA damage repair endonuclease UvsE n=1 Tax=Anaerobacillus alkaliphilus TaxID=1548597 RepID=A0A4Q0VY01_9BACI|nr:UV DNA damage repair endonuclease UvsE [Anaerobacillus alkaliphilus]RXJ04627.1 UV DNA damage repair endonuclease UvsE [Anaerobacillus alkaliphilus]
MKLGYACLNVSLALKMRTCRMKTVEIEGMKRVKELTLENLQNVINILKWNQENQIDFFRVTSDIVPFGSHEILTWDWWKDEDVLALTAEIKEYKEKHQMRLSVHPGQYTIINSPNESVVSNAFRDLEYHYKFIDLMGGTDMVIHVGGVYGNKDEAKKRFIENYKRLSPGIKEMLILENDDKSFHVQDVLSIYEEVGVPVCFDIHHHRCNPYEEASIDDLLTQVVSSWQNKRLPKMHISSGRNSKTDTSHHDYILKEDFDDFIELLGDRDVDLMFEAKKKELAVLRIRDELNENNSFL